MLLPDATQSDIIDKAVPGPRAAFHKLTHPPGRALYSDDTPVKVLSLIAERAKTEAAGLKPVAKAINTSGIVADLQDHKAVLFFTDHDRAGETLAKVRAQRARELQPPVQVCDALASNILANFTTRSLQLPRARTPRRGRDAGTFPPGRAPPQRGAGQGLRARCEGRQDKLSAEQRLTFHQEHNGPLMKGLHGWMSE